MHDSQYVSSLLNTLKVKFNLTDYEVQFLSDLNTELKRPMPASKVGLDTRINLLDVYRAKLLNLIYMMSDKYSEIEFKYKESYNQMFTRLVRQGRPSVQAIEAEIHQDPAMHNQQLLLINFDNFKSLLYGYLKSIDGCKSSCFNKTY